MESKKILITWGLGYIGSHTAVLFAQAGYEPILIDNLSNAHKTTVLDGIKEILGYELPFFEGDVRDSEFLENLFEEHAFIYWGNSLRSKESRFWELPWSFFILWEQH